MKCYNCENGKYLDMVPINDYLLVCALCDTKLDIDHANHTEEELKEKGYMHFSNEPLVDQLAEYFTKTGIFPDLKVVKLGISQWVYVNEEGKEMVELTFRRKKEEAEKSLNEINKVLWNILDDSTYDEPSEGYSIIKE